MPTIICPCVGNAFIRLHSSTPSTPAITSYQVQNALLPPMPPNRPFAFDTRDGSVLQFDVSGLDMYGPVRSVLLVQRPTVTSPWRQPQLLFFAARVVSGDINVEGRITWGNRHSILVTAPGVIFGRGALVTSGGVFTEQTNITQIYSAAFNQDGTFTIMLEQATLDIVADTNEMNAALVVWHSRAATNGAFPHLVIECDLRPSLAPTNLSPVIVQNPRGAIYTSWLHNPDPTLPREDPQTDSQIEVWQGTGTRRMFNGGLMNAVILPPHTFTTYEDVNFRARTRTQYNEWSAWSTVATFPLGTTPPLAPALVFPVNISVSGTAGVLLEWSYNSPYDIFPSQFEIRYRIDRGAWNYIVNYDAGDTPARSSAMTQVIDTQSRAEWQVRAWGELGDDGPWSDIAIFFTIGAPLPPIIVRVTNSNRPDIHFSALNVMAWELEILQGGKVIYATGNHPFDGTFQHTANQFFSTGSYLARMRITNEYGLSSEWGALAFGINTIPPQAVKLEAVSDVEFHVKLLFDGLERNIFIYRTDDGENWLRIARVEDVEYFEDYTVKPGRQYKYFARVVDDNFSFADSNAVTAQTDFLHTTLAESDSPDCMLKFLKQIDGKPTKQEVYGPDKTLTNFVGREMPVLQSGIHTNRNHLMSFYCSLDELEQLKVLSKSDKVLIMRDWRLGVIYGTVTGQITSKADGFSGHCIVTFSITEADYNREAAII